MACSKAATVSPAAREASRCLCDVRVRADRGRADEAAEDISRAIGFVGRDQLADQVRKYSGGLLQLDPERPR
jgi:hypothetical protein